MRLFTIAITVLFSVWQNIAFASLDARTMGGFLPGTKVLANDGENFYDIEDIMSGWFIYSFDEKNLKNDERRVVETFSHYTESVYTLKFQNIDEEINLSYDQVVLVKIPYDGYEWVRTEDLEPGQIIVSKAGLVALESLKEKENSDSEMLVWNIELDSLHTYYVGEEAQIIVHNANFSNIAKAFKYAFTAKRTGCGADKTMGSECKKVAGIPVDAFVDGYIKQEEAKKEEPKKN